MEVDGGVEMTNKLETASSTLNAVVEFLPHSK